MLRNILLGTLTAAVFLALSLSVKAQEDESDHGGNCCKSSTVFDHTPKVWYDEDYKGPKPTTLKAALAVEKNFLGANALGNGPDPEI